MPVHQTSGGGYQWGGHGKIYYGKGARERAARQGQAAHAAGYTGHSGSKSKRRRKRRSGG